MASWIRLTYSRRLFLWLVVYSLLLAGCIVGFQYHREKEYKAEALDAQLQLVNLHILDELDEGSMSTVNNHHFQNLRISVIDSSGRIISDNTPGVKSGSDHRDRAEVEAAMRIGTGFAVRRHSETTGETYFYSATRGKNGIIVRTAVPYSVSLRGLLGADYGFLWAIGGITLAMCVLGYFVTHRLGQNISRLNRFSERAERCERIYDTAPFPNDELGAISSHIVRLYANLQQAIADRDREHRAALRQQKESEKIKKRLTNNINHELKTPVASIHVCIETLLAHPDMDAAKREEFLRRCLANSERLEGLLRDVSLITRMDDAPSSIAKERVDLSAVISEVVGELTPVAESRGIEIVDRIVGKQEVEGNPSLLASVFRNLIDNAISYSGGTRIVIETSRQYYDGGAGSRMLELDIYDDGSGVPEESLPRLFERFYRVDKGRSRKAGGTGLGLSIVKNAILLHGGKITVSNRTPSGLRFQITLPLAPAT